ncbi:MAG: TetR/AcrR family transcriptional regulator [Azonexus sp.]
MTTRHDHTRQHILETGQRIIVGKGFASVGLNEILTAAGVPKGSFYHYFASKEQYGQALLQDYFDRYLADLDHLFAGDAGCGHTRLMRYWQRWRDKQVDTCAEQQCLVVKLAGEVADLSDAMRITLRDGTDQVVQRIARVIGEGMADGSIPPLEPQASAQVLYQLWLGASLLGKLHRDGAALDNALAFTRAMLSP